MLKSTLLAGVATLALAGTASAEGCDRIVFSDVGWTDITATTAATTLLLDALGYETEIKLLSVPVTYTGLAEGDIDVSSETGCRRWKRTSRPTATRGPWIRSAQTSKAQNTRLPRTRRVPRSALPTSAISRTTRTRWVPRSTASNRQ